MVKGGDMICDKGDFCLISGAVAWSHLRLGSKGLEIQGLATTGELRGKLCWFWWCGSTEVHARSSHCRTKL